jgi:hypothetical protein
VKFPPEFATVAGQTVAEVPAARFYVLMHELGHTMGLLHRYRGFGFMQEIQYYATISDPPFPNNLRFRYDPQDELRLRHHPDIFVRPGGAPYGTSYSVVPVPDVDLVADVGSQLKLVVSPLVPVVPLGAPVRLQVRLTNRADVTLPGPADLGLLAGSLFGQVIAPSGEARVFAPVNPLEYRSTADLAPGASLCHGESLWRGPDGALFPAPGLYRIEIQAGWLAPGGLATTLADCQVMIGPPCSYLHAKMALALLASQDIVLLLVFRSSPDAGSEDARKRIGAAMELLHQAARIDELRDSLAPIEAALLATGNLGQAAGLIDDKSLLTTSEIDGLLGKVKSAGADAVASAPVRSLVAICRRRIAAAFCAGFIDQAELERLLGLEGSS